LFLCYGGGRSQELTETIKKIPKEDKFVKDIKEIILHSLRNDENLKREIIDVVKEDLQDDLKEFSERFMCKPPYGGEDCGQCADGYFGEYPNCKTTTYALVTGYPRRSDETNQILVMDESGLMKTCFKPKSKYPLKVSGARGVYTAGRMIVCGGCCRETSACYFYADAQEGWTKLADMSTQRTSSSSIAIPDGILVTGGFDHNNKVLKTSEQIYANGTVKQGKPLPEPRYGHCMTEYKGQIISTGGEDENEVETSTVWSFNNHVEFTLTNEPSMKHNRSQHACGIVHSAHHNQRPLLVVAGGWRSDGNDKSEYLDFTLPGSQWQLCSEDFPNEMTGPKMTTTESKKQLFMTYQNEIYYFKCHSKEDCHWEQKNYQLQIKRSFHVMMEVPPSLVENC